MSSRIIVPSSRCLLICPLLLCAASVSAQPFGAGPVAFDILVDKPLVMPGDSDATLMLDLTGASDVATSRTPVAMAIVIDTSGSMDGQKIRDARSAAHALIDRLSAGDSVSIITYADSASIILANHPIASDRLAAHAAVEQITATGSTCISCGMEQAYRLIADSSTRHSRRVIVLSDGNANRGFTSAAELRMLASAALEAASIPSSTIGVGFDYNEDLMTGIANGGAGAYYFLPDSDAIATILNREFAELDHVVAGNLMIELTPASGVRFGQVRAAGAEQRGESLILNLGQLPAGTRRQVVIPIHLPEGDLGEVVSARTSFTSSDGTPHAFEASASITRSTDAAEVAAATDQRVVVRTERVQAAQMMEQAITEFQQGHRDQSTAELQRQIEQLRTGAQTWSAPELADEADQVEMLLETLADEDIEEEYIEGLRRHNRARSMEMERGAEPGTMYHDETVY